jgi:UPF0716 protein FxsA
MFAYLFLLLTLLPIIEILVLVKVGQLTEWWVPILWVIGMGLAGLTVVRWQGLRAFRQVREETRSGRMPADQFVDGLLRLLAGFLLIFPGVLTDVAGFALLIPPLRQLIKRGAKAWMRRHLEVRIGTLAAGFPPDARTPVQRQDEIIDARVISSRVEDVNPSR